MAANAPIGAQMRQAKVHHTGVEALDGTVDEWMHIGPTRAEPCTMSHTIGAQMH